MTNPRDVLRYIVSDLEIEEYTVREFDRFGDGEKTELTAAAEAVPAT
jgi:hypothetical protein